MFDLHSAFESLQLDNDILESSIDPDFITRFLLPYFQDLPREQLEAKLAEIIALEKSGQLPHSGDADGVCTVAALSQTSAIVEIVALNPNPSPARHLPAPC